MKRYILFLLLFVTTANISFAQTEAKAEKKQFIYVLHLVPKYLDTKIWTEADNKIISEHFDRLKKLLAEGVIIIAGKTENWDEKMFGIVIYYSDSFETAKELAEADPAVKGGLMTVEVYRYKIALIQDSYKK